MEELLPRRLDRRWLIALDACAALGYMLVMLVLCSVRAGISPAEVVAALAPGPALAVRRLWPVPVFALVMGLSLLPLALGLPGDAFVAAAYAAYPVALTMRRRPWIPTPLIGAASAFLLAGGSLAGPRDGLSGTIATAVLGLAILGGSWTVGRAVRERRAESERAARRYADRAVTDERLRIARELHDVVAHSMSLIAVKAGVAVHVAQARPDEALDALRVIDGTSRTALTEMRHLLGVLRTENPSEIELAPVPGLAGLQELADRAAMAGVPVDLHVSVGSLPEGLELAVYRIVQEGLTNVVKHAAPARCRVDVRSDTGDVHVEIADDGPGVRVLPGGTPGHGLIGMRERVTLYGGELTAGPHPGGGFTVTARLPLAGAGALR